MLKSKKIVTIVAIFLIVCFAYYIFFHRPMYVDICSDRAAEAGTNAGQGVTPNLGVKDQCLKENWIF